MRDEGFEGRVGGSEAEAVAFPGDALVVVLGVGAVVALGSEAITEGVLTRDSMIKQREVDNNLEDSYHFHSPSPRASAVIPPTPLCGCLSFDMTILSSLSFADFYIG